MKEEKNKVIFTREQNEIIQKMIQESELIGYSQGRDEILREIIEELRRKFLVKEFG